MSNTNVIQEKLIKAIEIIVEEKIRKKSKFNYYIEGKIVDVKDTDGVCTVKINGENSDIKYRDGLSLSVGDVVLVLVVNGDYSRKFIDLKRPYWKEWLYA